MATRRLVHTHSVRVLAAIEESVLSSLRALPHPSLPATLGATGTVVSAQAASHGADGGVSVDVLVSHVSPAASSSRVVETRVVEAARAAAAAAGVGGACAVRVRARPRAAASESAFSRAGPGLAGVRAAIAVASGKGGVGKSTVAVNLAFALAARGARTALLDTDIHGPSLPTMLRVHGGAGADGGVVHDAAAGTIAPLDVGSGVAAMSYGWAAPRNARGERRGVPMRGPLVASTVAQLAKFTRWGARDALVLDTPPGTGDVHMSLGQLLPLAGAVIVTTPQALAMVDASKGLDVWAALKVRPLALVLNMAHFDTGGGARVFPFGDGAARAADLAALHGIPASRVFSLPMDAALSAAGDAGEPAFLRGGALASVFDALAAAVADDTEAGLWASDAAFSGSGAAAGDGGEDGGAGAVYSLAWDVARGALVLRDFSDSGARETLLDAADVRAACRCAACLAANAPRVTGAAAAVEQARVVKVTPMGNYGAAIEWGDGHATGIFTWAQLGEIQQRKR
jgi:ATP-binding protein involved in chromosome partitioning